MGGLLGALLVLALPDPLAAKALGTPQCRPQKPQDFLKRPSIVRRRSLDGKANDKAVRYRVARYGFVEGVPFAEENSKSAQSNAVVTQFFGLPVQLHRAVEPALKCVERRIRATCRKSADRYQPRALGGFRSVNTFRGGEVSNHLFGIALDIDPDRNPCCGCVEPWPNHPACQGKAETVFQTTELPRCWIRSFERYGFYWLGRDPQLRDTMHFEFLGNPDRVVTR